MWGNDFVFLGLERAGASEKIDVDGTFQYKYRVDFTYRGLNGHGFVNISKVLADDPRFNLVDIATTIIKQELWRQENKERDVSIVWDKKERKNEQTD